MADTWITDITLFLDKDGEIITEPDQAQAMGEYFTAIILMASYPSCDYPSAYKVLCRCEPDNEPCREEIAGWVEPDTGDIFWICPKCQTRGRISNWKGTIWDLSDALRLSH